MFIFQQADKLGQRKVVMDNTEEECVKDENQSDPSPCQSARCGIFDLPTEIITHIVSYLSLQGKQVSLGQVRYLYISII